MTDEEMAAALNAIGASFVTEQVLLAGVGVFAEEVGTPGPWHGVRFSDGHVEGWARDKRALSALIRPHLTVDALLKELVARRT